MKLTDVTRGRIARPLFVVLFGVEGVGKTSFAASAPDPIFLCSEDGTSELDIARFPEPRDWGDVLDACDELLTAQHGHKTFVIDTLDWLEPLCWAHVAREAGKASVEDFGFGKGYLAALDAWRVLLARLGALRAKGMHIVLLAHHHVKAFRNPEGDDFERYEMKLHAKTASLLREAADACLFNAWETTTYERDGRTKGVQTGRRMLYTTRTAAYDAKNRFGLPVSLPIELGTGWSTLESAARAGSVLLDEIAALIVKVGTVDPEVASQAKEWLQRPRAAADLEKLKQRLTAKLETQATQTQATQATTKKEK